MWIRWSKTKGRQRFAAWEGASPQLSRAGRGRGQPWPRTSGRRRRPLRRAPGPAPGSRCPGSSSLRARHSLALRKHPLKKGRAPGGGKRRSRRDARSRETRSTEASSGHWTRAEGGTRLASGTRCRLRRRGGACTPRPAPPRRSGQEKGRRQSPPRLPLRPGPAAMRLPAALLLALLAAGAPEAPVSAPRSLVWGPGLQAAVVLPVRYFYLQAVSAQGRNLTRSPPGSSGRGPLAPPPRRSPPAAGAAPPWGCGALSPLRSPSRPSSCWSPSREGGTPPESVEGRRGGASL